MGGHGGLNILPQKSWNVYNFDNREKVKKDEEEAARQEALEKQQQRQRDAEFRLERMREAAQAKKRDTNELRITDGEPSQQPPLLENRVVEENDAAERPQHFNLFAGIEIAAEAPQSSTKLRDGSDRSGAAHEKRDLKQKKGQETKVPGPEDEGYAFGYGLVGKTGKRPWYSTKGFMVDRTAGDGGASSHTARSRSPEETRPAKRRRAKEAKPEKHAKKREAAKPTSGRKTMDELRAERVKREQQERDKARKLVVAKRRTDAHGAGQSGGRPYYNQSFGNAR